MTVRLPDRLRLLLPWVLGGLGILVVLAVYGAALGYAPQHLNPDLSGPPVDSSGAPLPPLDRRDRLTAAHNARLLVVSAAGALVVLAGLLYTAINYRLALRGQATERFTKTLERLGSDEVFVRTGGIHGLQQLIRDSATHHADIIDVLVAFIREQTPRARPVDRGDNPIWPRHPLPDEPRADVQAALTALGTRPRRSRRENRRPDLAGLHLQRAHLEAAQLRGAALAGVQLRHANLTRAQLQGADLIEAQMQGATLVGAQLQGARLSRALLRTRTSPGRGCRARG